MVIVPTHIHGNIVDLLCFTSPDSFGYIDVTSPGLSDHAMIKALLIMKLNKKKIQIQHQAIYIVKLIWRNMQKILRKRTVSWMN